MSLSYCLSRTNAIKSKKILKCYDHLFCFSLYEISRFRRRTCRKNVEFLIELFGNSQTQ